MSGLNRFLMLAILSYTINNCIDGKQEQHQLVPLPTGPQRIAPASKVNYKFEHTKPLHN